jgi:hypothetical protein
MKTIFLVLFLAAFVAGAAQTPGAAEAVKRNAFIISAGLGLGVYSQDGKSGGTMPFLGKLEYKFGSKSGSAVGIGVNVDLSDNIGNGSTTQRTARNILGRVNYYPKVRKGEYYIGIGLGLKSTDYITTSRSTAFELTGGCRFYLPGSHGILGIFLEAGYAAAIVQGGVVLKL